jgi:DNA primase
MARVSESDIAAIRENADIVAVIGRDVQLSQRGKEFVGLCPFHPDHKPSLQVSPRKGIYKCFSCGAGGDVFKYLIQHDGVEFLEAVRYVAEIQGYNIEFTGEDRAKAQETADLYNALDIAARLFQRAFNSNSPAQDYLFGRRKIDPEIAKDFGIGFAPREWDYLLQSIGPGSNADISFGTLERAGLIHARRDRSGFYDYFRGRLVFPITDLTGRVIGFSGRDLTGDQSAPKYLNSPESPVFNKSRILFGLPQASPLIKSTRQAVVVEGYLDAVAGQQAEFPVIATGGTVFTNTHAEILGRRYPGLEIILAFDGDNAGRTATLKASAQLLGETNAYVCLLPEGQDPDEIVLREPTPGTTLFESGRGGREIFAELLNQRVPVFDYYLREKLRDRKLDNPGAVSGFLREVAGDFRRIPRDVLPIYVAALSQRVGIDAGSITSVLSDRSYELDRGHTIPPREHCETELLHGMMLLPSVFGRFREVVSADLFTNPERRAVFEYLAQGGNVDSVHAPLLQTATDATERIMCLPGNEALRSHILHSLLSPPNAARRRNLGYFELMYRLIRSWEAFHTVNAAGDKGHSIERLGLLVGGLENTLAGWEGVGDWKHLEDLPGARIVKGKYLIVERSWKGDQIPAVFGGLGEYLLQHGNTFAQAIGASPATDITANHELVSFDLEDAPVNGNQVFSIASTTYRDGTLNNSTLFARRDEEEQHVLAGFLLSASEFDRIVTYRGSHDIAALRRRTAKHFGEESRAFGLVGQVKRRHRDVSVLLERMLNGRTLDKSLRTAETHFFGDCRGGFDVPSDQIPALYAEFLRTGNPKCVEWILGHNIRDTVSPLAILHMASVA